MTAMEAYKASYMDGFSGRKLVERDPESPYGLVEVLGYYDGCKKRGDVIGGFTNVP